MRDVACGTPSNPYFARSGLYANVRYWPKAVFRVQPFSTITNFNLSPYCYCWDKSDLFQINKSIHFRPSCRKHAGTLPPKDSYYLILTTRLIRAIRPRPGSPYEFRWKPLQQALLANQTKTTPCPLPPNALQIPPPSCTTT